MSKYSLNAGIVSFVLVKDHASIDYSFSIRMFLKISGGEISMVIKKRLFSNQFTVVIFP